MTETSATEKLRRLLDERGVKWRSKDEELGLNLDCFHDTRWRANGVPWCFTELGDNTCLTMCGEWEGCTPEQAIAATLVTPISADLRTALDFMRIWITDDAHLGESAISYEFERAEGLRKLDAIEQAIAATLGSGTSSSEAANSQVRCTDSERNAPVRDKEDSHTLLPCPFCGGEPTLDEGEAFVVMCRKCFRAGTVIYSTRAEAIEAWNTRAERTCQLEINTDMTAVVCSRCNCQIPKGSVLEEISYCPNCGAKVVD